MPELPEVETVVRTLARRITGLRIVRVAHVRADMVEPADFDFAETVTGRVIDDVRRRAKRIVFTLDAGGRFFVHLGMTGQLTIEPADAPQKLHTHLILELSNRQQLRLVDPRRFGAIVWLGDLDHANVGPEPLQLQPARLGKLLHATKRAVKVALLDQTMIAGIGNIYADEALFAAKIHPTTPACALSVEQVRALNRAIKQVLRTAIGAGGSSIRDYVDAEGRRGSFQQRHQVYGREAERCVRCKRATIERIVLGGRSTHFCPLCQRHTHGIK